MSRNNNAYPFNQRRGQPRPTFSSQFHSSQPGLSRSARNVSSQFHGSPHEIGSSSRSNVTASQPEQLSVPTPPSINNDPPLREDRMIPVTVKMLKDAALVTPDTHPPQICGAFPTTVRVVGKMWSLTSDEVKACFTFEDGTGGLRCTFWFTGLPSDADVLSIGDGTYVEIFGRPEVLERTPFLKVLSCRKITNFNDITTHFLYTIYANADLRRPPPPPSERLLSQVYEIVKDYTDEGDPGLTFRFICNSVSATDQVVRQAINILIARRKLLQVIGEDRYILAHH